MNTKKIYEVFLIKWLINTNKKSPVKTKFQYQIKAFSKEDAINEALAKAARENAMIPTHIEIYDLQEKEHDF